MPISVGFWEWGCPNRGDTHINDTEILYKRQRNWAELAFAKTSGIVTRGALFSYWPIRKTPRRLCESSLAAVSFWFLKWWLGGYLQSSKAKITHFYFSFPLSDDLVILSFSLFSMLFFHVDFLIIISFQYSISSLPFENSILHGFQAMQRLRRLWNRRSVLLRHGRKALLSSAQLRRVD